MTASAGSERTARSGARRAGSVPRSLSARKLCSLAVTPRSQRAELADSIVDHVHSAEDGRAPQLPRHLDRSAEPEQAAHPRAPPLNLFLSLTSFSVFSPPCADDGLAPRGLTSSSPVSFPSLYPSSRHRPCPFVVTTMQSPLCLSCPAEQGRGAHNERAGEWRRRPRFRERATNNEKATSPRPSPPSHPQAPKPVTSRVSDALRSPRSRPRRCP